jgi:hypothetical protein
MEFEERVELDLSVLDNCQLLLKYGPVAKAKSYAATHYGYILRSRYIRCICPIEDGAIILDMSIGKTCGKMRALP